MAKHSHLQIPPWNPILQYVLTTQNQTIYVFSMAEKNKNKNNKGPRPTLGGKNKATKAHFCATISKYRFTQERGCSIREAWLPTF